MRKPRPLALGQAVRLVAPSGPVPADRFAAGVQILAHWGLVPRWDARVFATDGYLAGDDARRADELIGAFASDEPEGVIAARGGYGVMRLLDAISARTSEIKPRFFQGFSDLTALHLYFLGEGDLVTFHGPNVTTLALADEESLRRTHDALLGLHRESTFRWEGLRPVTGGRASGRLVVGNLSMLGAMAGTRWAPPLAGAILVVEDIHESPYRLDRLLTQVALSTDAARLAGVAIGDLSGAADEAPATEAAVRRFADAIGRPVVAGFPAGHGPTLHPVPEGIRAELDADTGLLRVIDDPYDR